MVTNTLVEPRSVDQWYLCGPLAMVEDLTATLTELGVDPERVNTELFFDQRIEAVEVTDHTDGLTEVTVTIDGRQSVVYADPTGPPLLDYARSVRSEVPFACKGGMCATCKAIVTGGEVTMTKNYALTAEELAAGYVLTCQARPVDGHPVSISYDVHGGVGPLTTREVETVSGTVSTSAW